MQRHFIYWMLPTIAVGTMIAAYFSGIDALREIVAPRINREFGLLENLQLVLIAIVIWGAIHGLRRAQTGPEKALFAVIAVVSVFVFLEEMDYGLHFYEYLTGNQGPEIRNFHNENHHLSLINKVAGVIIAVFYIALPLLGPYSNNRIVRYFTPPRLILATALCAFAARSMAHYLEDAGYYPHGPLDGNIAEFREFFTYYLTMLYVLGLAKILRK